MKAADTPETAGLCRKWYLHSGAMSHLLGNLRCFSKLDKTSQGNLNLADNSTTKIKGKGSVEFLTEVTGKKNLISLNKVSLVPKL